MSISTFNKLLQNQGCVWFVSAVTLAGVIGGFLYQGCAADMRSKPEAENEQASDIVARVGDVTISEKVLNARVEDQLRQQFGGAISIDKLPQVFVTQQLGGALNGLITNAQLAYLGKKAGLKPTDDEVVRLAQDTLKQRVEEARQQLIQSKRLKPNATQADFDAIIKQQGGKTVAEILRDQEKDIRDGLKDPARRENILASVYYPTAMLEAAKKKIPISDDDLKKTFTTYNFKRIYFLSGAHGSTRTPIEDAKKVYDEIKGGISFEDAMNKYSGDRPDAKKKLSEKVTTLRYAELNQVPEYKPLLSLKPGEMSQPLPMGPGAAIYKLIDIKSDLPKDFEAKKSIYRDQYVAGQAMSAVQQQLDSGIPVEWVNKAYQVMYESNKMSGQPLDDATRKKKTFDLIKMAEDAAADRNPQTARMASSLALNLFKGLYSSSTPEQKKELIDKGIEVYSLFFRTDEDPMARTELADFYIQKGMGGEATAAVSAAALANQYRPGDEGQGAYNAINAKVRVLRDKNMATADQLKEIEKLQEVFRLNKVEEDKRAAEEKKQREAQEKADKAKAAEAAKAKKANPAGAAPKGETQPSGDKPSKPKGK